MNEQTVEETFWKMCEEATNFEAKNFDSANADVRLVEPYLLRILNFVKENPQYEELFKQCFIQMGTGKKRYVDLILLYCMRELQYPEVQKAVNEHFRNLGGPSKAPRLMNYVSDVNIVYEKAPWEDAIFFQYHWEREYPEEPWPGSNDS